MKTPNQCPKLTRLADACVDGAPNVAALLRSVSEAVNELAPVEVAQHPAIKVILGQLSYLSGESFGPSVEALEAFQKWRLTETSPV